ncbi:MAG: hypothetical protein SF182_19080 [Deltaproteobacteria bacterium]|nr:hypothetical protein [Deltaproteobacteria bacterium]
MPFRLRSLLIASLVAWFSIVGVMSAPAAAVARMLAARCCAMHCHHAAAVAPRDCCCQLTADRRVPAALAATTPEFGSYLPAARLTSMQPGQPLFTAESIVAAAPARAAPIYLLMESLRL